MFTDDCGDSSETFVQPTVNRVACMVEFVVSVGDQSPDEAAVFTFRWTAGSKNEGD